MFRFPLKYIRRQTYRLKSLSQVSSQSLSMALEETNPPGERSSGEVEGQIIPCSSVRTGVEEIQTTHSVPDESRIEFFSTRVVHVALRSR